jgi:hypothetical protein
MKIRNSLIDTGNAGVEILAVRMAQRGLPDPVPMG